MFFKVLVSGDTEGQDTIWLVQEFAIKQIEPTNQDDTVIIRFLDGTLVWCKILAKNGRPIKHDRNFARIFKLLSKSEE